MRLSLVTLLFLMAVTPARSQTAGALPSQGSLRGAWNVISMSLSGTGGTTTNDSPQPGLVLFTERHYSVMYVEGSAPRKPFADAQRATDAEKIVAFDTFAGHTGTYAVADSMIAMQVIVAKLPNLMTGELSTTFMRFAHRVTGDTLRMTRRTPRGAFTMLLVRAR